MARGRQRKLNPLEYFGSIVTTRLRDGAIDHADGLLRGHWKAPALRKLQGELATLSPRQRDVVRRTVIASIDSAVHDFLFSLQEECDGDGRIKVLVDGKEIARDHDGVHGEPYGPDGWYARLGKHGAPPTK